MINAVDAYIGIGSNLNNPEDQVRRAFDEIAALPCSCCMSRSPLYRSQPVGPQEQPYFINAVARLETSLEAEALLNALQRIEQAHGRKRDLRWGPRTLDLDILLYGDRMQEDARLTLPHPRMHERAFVLYPLRDVASGLKVPGRGDLDVLFESCPTLDIERIEAAP